MGYHDTSIYVYKKLSLLVFNFLKYFFHVINNLNKINISIIFSCFTLISGSVNIRKLNVNNHLCISTYLSYGKCLKFLSSVHLCLKHTCFPMMHHIRRLFDRIFEDTTLYGRFFKMHPPLNEETQILSTCRLLCD